MRATNSRGMVQHAEDGEIGVTMPPEREEASYVNAEIKE